MRVQILVEALWITQIPEERVEAVEGAGGGVVIPGSEVLLADAGVELFAAVEEVRGGEGGVGERAVAAALELTRSVHDRQHLAVGVEHEELHDGGGQIGQHTHVAVAIVAEDECHITRDVALGVVLAGRLGDLIVAEGEVDRFGDKTRVRIVVCLTDDLLVAGVVLVIDEELGQCPRVPRQVRIRVDLVQRTGANAGRIVVVRRLLDAFGELMSCVPFLYLVARKWDFSDRRRKMGRPRVRPEIADLALRMARENPSWGYDRIQGALANVGYRISDSTVANILRAHGIEPAPQRQRTGSWATFLRSHWETIGAIDFTTVEVWTRGGLVTFYVLVAMRLKSREIVVAGVTASPDAAWVNQMARNLTCDDDGLLDGTTHLILDRDTKFLPPRRYLEEQTSTEAV